MAERAHPWYRFTNRLNALVWALPAPRRARAALSRIVYRNPPMPRSDVLRILQELNASGVEPVVMGGWGIDALVGEEQRVHHDLDLILDCDDLERALVKLGELGFEEWFRNLSPEPYGEHGIEGDVVVVRDSAMRVVDLHPMRLDDLEAASTTGKIGGDGVRCVSAEVQLAAHSGYRKRWPGDRRRHEAALEGARRALHGAEPQLTTSGGSALAQQSPDLV